MWNCFFGYSYSILNLISSFATHVKLRPTFCTQIIFHRYDCHICYICHVWWPTTLLETIQSDCKKGTWSPTWWACSTCPCQPPLEANRSPDRTQLVVLPAFLYVKQQQIVLERSVRLNLDPGRGHQWSFGKGRPLMIIFKRPAPQDDHMQEAGPSGGSFARGQPLWMIICKRSGPLDDDLQKADPSG